MNLLAPWLNSQPKKTAPLFDEDDLVVKTFIHNNMRKLRRHPEFDNMIIETVENGLQKKNEVLGNWAVNGIKTVKSRLFNCKKGDVLSFNVLCTNINNPPNKEAERQLHISQIIIRKKG